VPVAGTAFRRSSNRISIELVTTGVPFTVRCHPAPVRFCNRMEHHVNCCNDVTPLHPMTTFPKFSAIRFVSNAAAVIAALLVFACALLQSPTLKAAEAATPPPAEPNKPTLPLTSTFEKVANAENGPFVLKVKNTSTTALKVNTRVLLSVSFHAESKARKLPEHTIEPGQVWSIPDLSAADKVIITAEGFAPLEIVVR
jgi:hypothetical protein